MSVLCVASFVTVKDTPAAISKIKAINGIRRTIFVAVCGAVLAIGGVVAFFLPGSPGLTFYAYQVIPNVVVVMNWVVPQSGKMLLLYTLYV